MESLRIRRARLRLELQDAYEIWMTASERPSTRTSVDVSGTRDAARGQWHAYLVAKERLVLAWAED